MDLGWTSFPRCIPTPPERDQLRDLRPAIKEALAGYVHGWTNTEKCVNDILDKIVEKVTLNG